MAILNFIGKAKAVAQVDTITISYDASTTYNYIINGVTVSVAADTDLATTRAAIIAALNAETHPYFDVLTASAGGASTEIDVTADVAGFPFTMTTSITGGSATNSIANDVASKGPHHYDDASNWDTGAIPVNSDDVVLANSNVDILFGLNQSAVTLDSFTKKASFTGKIGLDPRSFYRGEGVSDGNAEEYRETYLKLQYDNGYFGETEGESSVSGCGRCKINNTQTSANETKIYETASAAIETGMPAFRFIFAHADANVQVLGQCKAGIGFGVDTPGEACTMGNIWVSKAAANSKVIVGANCAYDNFVSYAGTHKVSGDMTGSAAMTVHGGVVTTEGVSTNGIPTMTVNGGTVIANHRISTGNSIATLNVNGGTVDGTQDSTARTWATVNHNGGKLISDSHITMTSYVKPSKRFELSMLS